MSRVLGNSGRAILVVPSLYKLDAVKVPHILQKRFSSHENRLLISEWVTMLEGSGLKVDSQYSRPLGVASGLLYLAWLNPDYVPVRENENSVEEFSEKAMQFHNVKKLIGRVDERIDEMVLASDDDMEICRDKFERGDILGLLRQVQEWYESVTIPSMDVREFVEGFNVGSVSVEAMGQLQNVVVSSDTAIHDNAFFGNSALLVLHK